VEAPPVAVPAVPVRLVELVELVRGVVAVLEEALPEALLEAAALWRRSKWPP
jgi:hypothetical protein